MANNCYVCKDENVKRYEVNKHDNIYLCKKCYKSCEEHLRKPRNLNDTIRDVARRMKNRHDYRVNKNKDKFVPAKAKKAKSVKPTVHPRFAEKYPEKAQRLYDLNEIKVTDVRSDKYYLNKTYWVPKRIIVFN